MFKVFLRTIAKYLFFLSVMTRSLSNYFIDNTGEFRDKSSLTKK